jgi:hypothetical protein
VWVDMCSPPRLTTAPSHWHWPHKAQEPPKLLRPRGEPKCLTSNIDRTGLFDTVKHPANMVLEHKFQHLSIVRHQSSFAQRGVVIHCGTCDVLLAV